MSDDSLERTRRHIRMETELRRLEHAIDNLEDRVESLGDDEVEA